MQAQGKHQQALQLVEGPLGDAISMPAERRIVKASLHVSFGILTAAPKHVTNHSGNNKPHIACLRHFGQFAQ